MVSALLGRTVSPVLASVLPPAQVQQCFVLWAPMYFLHALEISPSIPATCFAAVRIGEVAAVIFLDALFPPLRALLLWVPGYKFIILL
jgi:hypothetical protein